MRKFFVIAIPIVSLFFFVLVMLSGSILKRPLGKDDDVAKSIQLIIKDVESENWENADVNVDTLSNSWRKIVKRIQFSSERDEINAFNINIAHLRGAIMSKDKSGSLMALNEAYELWDGLSR